MQIMFVFVHYRFIKYVYRDFLWSSLWDNASVSKCEETLIILACKRASEGLLPSISPAACQRLVNFMIIHDPQTLQKALLHIPLKCMDLHQVIKYVFYNLVY